MVENGSIANPFRQEAQRLIDDSMPLVRQHIDSAIVAGWLMERDGVVGAESPSNRWFVQKGGKEYPGYSSLMIIDRTPKIERVRSFILSVIPETKFRIKGFLGLKSDFEVVDFDMNTEKGLTYKYDVGKRLDDYVDENGVKQEAFVPVIRSEIGLMEEDGEAKIGKVSQCAKFNNAAVGSVDCDVALLGFVRDDKFSFSITVSSAEDVESCNVASNFTKFYEPTVGEGGDITFAGYDLGAEISLDLPQPFTIKVKDRD